MHPNKVGIADKVAAVNQRIHWVAPTAWSAYVG